MKTAIVVIASIIGIIGVAIFSGGKNLLSTQKVNMANSQKLKAVVNEQTDSVPKPVDTLEYQGLMKKLANKDSIYWPAKNTPVPLHGAILPYHRIVAYYGNLYSKKMGILGELPPKQMLQKLQQEIAKWKTADPNFPVKPALHYIAVVAQGAPGADGKYRLRMPDKHIDSVIAMARSINAIVFLDIQIALSTVQNEVPKFEKYLKMSDVHLGLDPEFSMKTGKKPGTVIGTMDAAEINWASRYLKNLVKTYQLPPKILILHRFTRNMITNVPKIELQPEVQFVMEMDGWGAPELKKGTYKNYIYPYPKEFAGIKLFYKNDVKQAPHRMLTTDEVLKLKPAPIYIQYQ